MSIVSFEEEVKAFFAKAESLFAAAEADVKARFDKVAAEAKAFFEDHYHPAPAANTVVVDSNVSLSNTAPAANVTVSVSNTTPSAN